MSSNTIYIVVEEEDDFGLSRIDLPYTKTKIIGAYWSKELALEKCIGSVFNRTVEAVPIMDGFDRMKPRFDPIKPIPNPYLPPYDPDPRFPKFDPINPGPHFPSLDPINPGPRFPSFDPINPIPNPGSHFPSFDPLAKKPNKPNSGFDI